MAQGNGGIIGPVNVTSKGKNTITSKTSSGSLTTQPGTRVVQALVVAGGGGGGASLGGGGVAGGYRDLEIPVSGNTSYCATVGGGGSAGPGPSGGKGAGAHRLIEKGSG